MPIQQPITLTSLSGFDWFLVALVALSTLLAFRRGIVKVLFSFAGLILGFLLASWNYLALAQRLHPYISSFAAAQLVAFFAILVAVMLVVGLLAALVRRTVHGIGLGFVDRLLGAVFGFLRGLALGVAVILALVAFAPRSSVAGHSRLLPGFLAAAHAVSFVVPEHLQGQLASGTGHLLEQTRTLLPAESSGQTQAGSNEE